MNSENQPIRSKTYWPSPQDYCEAVQTPRLSFADEELLGGTVKTTTLGLPVCMSGNFASVFCFQCGPRKVAVRCFLHDIADQEARYAAISQYVLGDDLDSTVPFRYIENGIQIKGQWFPILKMDWVDGVTLSEFVSANIKNGTALNLLAGFFKEMVLDLERAGIAHGDLQHDNILVSDDALRLVDYDGMFVPGLQGQKACELGHASYQHPARNLDTFGDYLDRFSAWLIYLSLKTISRDPGLYNRVGGGADCLLFRQADLLDPDNSRVFQAMAAHPDADIRQYSEALRRFLLLPVDQIPSLFAPLSDLDGNNARGPRTKRQTATKQPGEAGFAKLYAGNKTRASGRGSPGVPDESHRPAQPRQTKPDKRPSRLPEWIHLPTHAAANSTSNLAMSAPPVIPLKIDPFYQQFNIIQLPKLTEKTTRAECQYWIEQQLSGGEQVQWVTQPLTCNSASSVVLRMTIGLVLFVFFVLALYIQPALSVVLVLTLLPLYAALCRFAKVTSVCALTDRRLIYVDRYKYRENSISIPLDRISHIAPATLGSLANWYKWALPTITLVARRTFHLSRYDTDRIHLHLADGDVAALTQWLPLKEPIASPNLGVPQAQVNLYSANTLLKKLAAGVSPQPSGAILNTPSPTPIVSPKTAPVRIGTAKPISALTLLSWANQQNSQTASGSQISTQALYSWSSHQNGQWTHVAPAASITHSGPLVSPNTVAAKPAPSTPAYNSSPIPLILNVGPPAHGVTVQEASKLLGLSTAGKHITPQNPFMVYGQPPAAEKDKDPLPAP